ncbi:LuxR family transcriptional regulator [Paenibacillus sp.]|uniref:LuxR family transcriptional regulator n=1 Tax=Paenibacillus sp. TaxID=58172 RepID=UPI002D553A75|nr:LuxR family transcriptional regulator [Paenibacillus sp.]HZG58880.1 LuxR family transcriptional regulator [Paenibacillus sp.]
MSERLGSRLDALEEDYFVGRAQELFRFRQALRGEAGEARLINVYGTGGIGKSTLLDRFGRIVVEAGGLYVAVDSREFAHTPEGLCAALDRKLAAALGGAATGGAPDERSVAGRINGEAERRIAAIAFDTFEEMGDLEHWLRESFFPMLHGEVKLIVAGRTSLQGKWLTSPAWRSVTMRMPIGQLRPEEVKAYLEKHGCTNEKHANAIVLRSQGHPLTLSLAIHYVQLDVGASDDAFSPENDTEFLRFLSERWLKEVPESLRELTEAASALRCFNQEILSEALDRPVEASDFDRLISLSFVRATEKGWMLHDVMRDTVGGLVRLRAPETHRLRQARAVRYYYRKIVGAGRREAMTWEMAELIAYLGGSTVKAYMHKPSSFQPYYTEPLTAANLEEAERYMRDWTAKADAYHEMWRDPDTGEQIDLSFHMKVELPVIRSLRLPELLRLDAEAMRLFRSADGELAGFTVMIPIHEGTVEELRRMPYSKAFFESRTEAELAALRTPREQPAGWFIRAVNIKVQGDPRGTYTAFQSIFSLLLRGGLIVVSPPPVPLFQGVFQGLGFEQVPGVVHTDYDGTTPTPTFLLDTRGNRLGTYLRGLVAEKASFDAPPAAETTYRTIPALSAREQEVAELAAEGLSNAEIAERLFVSEVTVKKHLTSAFHKTGARNRVTLARLLRNGEEVEGGAAGDRES